MIKKKEKEPSPMDKAWRKGYEMGVSITLENNNIALQIGKAILSALDERYERHKEDY